jgi:hypothetical protein
VGPETVDQSIMGTRLYVGNLSFNATADSVREAFTQFGTVEDAHVVTDRETGRSRGFAFVTMGDKAPKSKQRNQKQKDAEKNQTAAKAKAKQVGAAQQAPAKGKK